MRPKLYFFYSCSNKFSRQILPRKHSFDKSAPRIISLNRPLCFKPMFACLFLLKICTKVRLGWPQILKTDIFHFFNFQYLPFLLHKLTTTQYSTTSLFHIFFLFGTYNLQTRLGLLDYVSIILELLKFRIWHKNLHMFSVLQYRHYSEFLVLGKCFKLKQKLKFRRKAHWP
jgi:hypothetical protein